MTSISKLLISEYPLLILPTLAIILGLNEAIILQQIHYWLENVAKNQAQYQEKDRQNYQDGHWWTYQSIPDWQRTAFPFWSQSTIKRTILHLEALGVLITRQLARDKRDRTNWYSINYECLNQLHNEYLLTQVSEPCIGSNCIDGTGQSEPIPSGQNDPMLNETLIKNNDEREEPPTSFPDEKVLDDLVQALGEVTGMDSRLNRTQLAKNAKSLLLAGYNASLVKANFGPGGAWYSQDWRGKKGELPTLKNVVEQIAILSRQFAHSPPETDLDHKRDQVRGEIQAARKKRLHQNHSPSNAGGAL